MPKPVHAVKILASVELGNPAADCTHFGICSISVLSPRQWAVFKPRHFRHVKALISLTIHESLKMEFPLESMRPDTRAEFFPKEGFRVDSARILPDSILSKLGLSPSLYVAQGVYSWKYFNAGLRVELALVAAF
ncbi:MAG: hypothetical protein ACKVU0_14620 [Saprospiraceae bacterium]